VSGNRLEKEIIGIFNRDISSFLSINQISKKLKKAYPYINAKVTELIDEGVLNKAQIGRSYQCSINLHNEKAVALMTLNEVEKKDKHLMKIDNSAKLIEEINSIKKEFRIYTVLLYDSSLIFVLDYLHDKEAIRNMYRAIKNFELIFFDRAGFQQYLIQNRNALPDHSILYSYEKYFEFLSEVKDGMLLQNMNQMPETKKKRQK
jgi:hypothetical protein